VSIIKCIKKMHIHLHAILELHMCMLASMCEHMSKQNLT